MTSTDHPLPRGPARQLPLVFLLLFGCLLPGGCSLPDDTAAVVNGRPIMMADLEEAMDRFHGQFGEMTPPGEAESQRTRRVLLDRLIDRALMLEEVEKRGLHPSEESVAEETRQIQGELEAGEFEQILAEAGLTREQWREKLSEDLALARLQRKVIEAGVEVTEEQIEEYFDSHRTEFDVPEQVRASQILLRTREEAAEAARRISGGEPFAEVAREVSLSPDGEKGGDIGYFSRGQMPQEFDAVVFALPAGKVSSVVETAYGFHLFLVTDRREARQRDRSEMREKIRGLLLAEAGEGYFRQWLGDLRAAAEIRYNKDLNF